MALASRTGGRSKSLILTAMIFAVAMTFIDQTIVSIAAPTIQHNLGLSSSGMQWAINAYLLALAAFFAFGGRLADTAGTEDGRPRGNHLRWRVGVVRRDTQRRCCGGMAGGIPRGAGPGRGDHVPGRDRHRGGNLRSALPRPGAGPVLRHRGGLTAIGPIAGGYLIQWTWRAIFWINIPVALIALVLIAIAKPVTGTGLRRWTTAAWP